MDAKKDIGNRIKAAREAAGMTQEELAFMVGYSGRSSVAKLESGKRDIVRTKISAIAKALGVKPAFIMGWTDEQDTINELSTFSYTFIPAKVSAGALEDVEAIYKCPKIDVPDAILGKYARDKSIVFMSVNGESMNKVIANGAIIAVKTNIEKESLKNGDIVIASYQNEYVMKHFIDNKKGEKFILRPNSTDPSFTDKIIRYEDAENLKIFGKVVIYSVVL